MIARRDHRVRVIARRDLSPTCFALELLTAEPLEAVPGQFGMLTCGEGLDPLLRRAFSLAAVRRHGGGTLGLGGGGVGAAGGRGRPRAGGPAHGEGEERHEGRSGVDHDTLLE